MELVLLQALSALLALVFAVTALVCRRLAPAEPGLREWQLAATFLMASNFAGALRGVIPWQAAVIASHCLGAFGHSHMVTGSRQLLGHSPGRSLTAPLLLVGLASSTWFTLVQPSVNARLFVIGIVLAPVTFYSGTLFWRHREPGITWLMRPAAVTFALVAGAYLLRGMVAITLPPIPEDQMGRNPVVWAFQPFAIAFFAMASVVLVMVVSLRRQSELESERDEEHLTNERLLEMSWSDPMTGVASRVRIVDLLEAECRFAAASGAQPVAVLTQVCGPSSVGGAERDRMIVDAARSLREALGLGPIAVDCVGRWGFEEFLVILPDADLLEAESFAARARAAISDSHAGVEACRFVATAFEWGDTAESIGARLDEGLRRAKDHGGDSGSSHVVFV